MRKTRLPKITLKAQLGTLKRKEGLLHADGGEQGEVPDAARQCPVKELPVGEVFYPYAVSQAAAATCDARQERVNALALKGAGQVLRGFVATQGQVQQLEQVGFSPSTLL